VSWNEVSADGRMAAMDQAFALIAATQRLVIDLIAAAGASEDYVADGATDMADWLVARYGMARSTAREWVRIAESLGDLPAIADAFGEGRLGWDRMQALTRFATAETDATLAGEAPVVSAATVQMWAREQRKLTRADSSDAHSGRAVRWWWNHRDRSLRLSGRFPEDDGARLVKAVERIAERLPKNPATGLYDSAPVRNADALIEMASRSLGADSDPDRATVVVHAPIEALTDGAAELEAGVLIGSETLRRLACDCRAQMIAHDRAGAAVGIGRVSRTIPPWLARQIRHRDRGCRFPGCGRIRRTHAHHRHHWADGGPTDLDNLITLCPYHHRLVHEYGWTIEGDLDAEVRFIRPDGREFGLDPARLAADWWDNFLAEFHNYGQATGTDPPDTS